MTTAELVKSGVKLPSIPWAWLSVGSDGRREQTLRTDMDNALVFAGSETAEADESHREIFLKLANKVIAKMVECGFSRCRGGVMASNPKMVPN